MQMHFKRYIRFFVFIFFCFCGLHAAPTDYLAEYFLDSRQPLNVVELFGGLSGAKNYKVTVEGKDYVLRILNPENTIEEKKLEITAATYAGNIGIGPFVYFVADHYLAMIMDFVKGDTLSPELFSNEDKLCVFLQTMKRLHEPTRDFPTGLTVFERIRTQVEKIKQNEIPFPKEAVDNALKKLSHIEEMFKEEMLVPCHNDLNSLNVIAEGAVFKFIDWTDAGMGYAYNDLGYFILVNNIEEKRHCEILNHYLGRLPSEQELLLLKLMKQVSMFRIYTSIFSAFEPSMPDWEMREKRQLELEEMLWEKDLPPVSYYFDLHMKGQLNGDEVIRGLKLSALRSFLRDE